VAGVKRGDLVTIAVGGEYGKPRPALVVQADPFAALPSVTVLRLTSDIVPEHLIRLTVQPGAENGLRIVSQVIIDKAVSVPRERIGAVFGHLDAATMLAVSRTLVAFLGLEGVAA
jgi:mRNA interferase MazF